MAKTHNKIPKSFMLFSSKIEIIFDVKKLNKENVFGLCEPLNNKIILTNKERESELSVEIQTDTFYHEKVHMILSKMEGYENLYSDEKFVDLFGRLLKQSDLTSEY